MISSPWGELQPTVIRGIKSAKKFSIPYSLTLTLPGPSAGVGGSLTVTVA